MTTKGERTRARILEAALPLLAEHGYHSTSFQMIADQVNLSQAALLRHYPTKEQLFQAVLEKILRTNHEYVSERQRMEDPARTALIRHFEGNLLWAKRWPEQARNILLLYYLATFPGPLQDLYNQVLNIGRDRVLKYLHEGIHQRAFSFKRTTPEEAAILLQESLLGSILNLLATGTISRPAAIKSALERLKYALERISGGK